MLLRCMPHVRCGVRYAATAGRKGECGLAFRHLRTVARNVEVEIDKVKGSRCGQPMQWQPRCSAVANITCWYQVHCNCGASQLRRCCRSSRGTCAQPDADRHAPRVCVQN